MFLRIAKVMIAASLFSASYAMASTTVCTNGSDQRSVEVVYQNPGSQVPCEVQYTKSSGTQTLWSYQNEVGQCESHASEFVAKIEGWGFTCNEQAVETPAAAGETTQPAQ